MLVCSISYVAPKTISAAIAEAVTAAATTATQSSVSTVLVDDPTSAIDLIDAYLGEIMVEAATATDTVEVTGFVYVVAVDEATAAADGPDGTVATGLIARSGMIAGVYVNSDGTSRQANVNGVMVNL